MSKLSFPRKKLSLTLGSVYLHFLLGRNVLTFTFQGKQIPSGFPFIIQNPGMKVQYLGKNALLVCEAGGDPLPTITWIKDTMPVDLNGDQAKPRISMMQQGKLSISLATFI